MKSNWKGLLLAISLFMITENLFASQPTTLPAPPSLPPSNARVFTLSNGATLIVEEDHNAPVASVQVLCSTGSINEGKWMGAGLSHILEHMLFKGTDTRKVGDIARRVQELGGYINAYTSYDRTVYLIDVPSSGAYEAVSILSDAMMNSTLPLKEYDKEQEVIRREFAMGFDDPNRKNWQLIARTVFSESPYRHPVIGYLDIYNQLKREDVWEYYKQRYVPNNLTFVVVGDVDALKIRDQLEAFFKGYPRKPLETIALPMDPPQVGKRFMAEEFPTELSRVSLSWKTPGITDADMPALDVLATVLGTGDSSILNRELRERSHIVHAISAQVIPFQDCGIFGVMATCDADKRKQVQDSILELIAKIRSQGVTEQELQKAKLTFLSAELQNLVDTRGRAAQLVNSWLFTRNINFGRDYLNKVQGLTTADLRTVANKYLKADTLSITELNPVGSPSSNVTSASKAQPSQRIVKKFALPNGLRVLVCEDHRLPLAVAVAAFRGGLLLESPQKNGISFLLASTVTKGTKTRSAEQISEEVESLGGAIKTESGNNSMAITVDMMSPYLHRGLDILADVIENANFPDREVELEKSSQIAAIKSEKDQITSIARNIVRRQLFGSNPYGMRALGTEETVKHLGSADLRKFKEEVLVAQNGVLAIFGDVKAEEVFEMVKKAFEKLPSGHLASVNPPVSQPLPSKMAVEEFSPKQQAVVMFGYRGLEVSSPDRPAMEVLQEASNDLSSRFFDRIREKNALAYYVGATQMIGLAPGLFVYYLGTDPLKVKRAHAEMADEIHKVATEGLTVEEVSRAKQKLLGAEAMRLQNTFAFASSCAVDELMGLGYDHYTRRTPEIEAVTPENVQKVASKYLAVPGYVEVTVCPPPDKSVSPTSKEPLHQ